MTLEDDISGLVKTAGRPRSALSGQARGPLLTDAHLATLATEHGATLCTTDRDFGRLPGLRFMNPLSG